MPNSTHWKHSNDAIMRTEYAQPNPDKTMVLRDWNRMAHAADKCTYFIDGRPLSALRPEGFDNVEALQNFFAENLCQNVYDLAERKALVDMAMQHLYQAGLPHATHSSIMALAAQHPNKVLASPVMHIDYRAGAQGILITERNTYLKWLESGRISHQRTADKYYAQTNTVYFVSSKQIELKDLTIDCPSRNLAPIFDQRPHEQQVVRAVSVLRETIASVVAPRVQAQATELDRVIYRHPQE